MLFHTKGYRRVTDRDNFLFLNVSVLSQKLLPSLPTESLAVNTLCLKVHRREGLQLGIPVRRKRVHNLSGAKLTKVVS